MSTQDLHELMALKGFQKKSISVLSDTGNSTLTSLGNHGEKDSAKLKLKALEHGRMKKEMAKENEMMMKEKERNNDKDKESSLGNVAVTVMGTQELKLKLKSEDLDNIQNKTETTTIITVEISEKKLTLANSTNESH